MIEKFTKHLAIYNPDGWRQAVSMAKRTKPVYDVLKVNNTDVLDFMTFMKRNMPNRTIAGDGSKVEWTKIHSFQYRKKESEKVFFKYEIGDANYNFFTLKHKYS